MDDRPLAFAQNVNGQCQVWAFRDPAEDVRAHLETSKLKVDGPILDISSNGRMYIVHWEDGTPVKVDEIKGVLKSSSDFDYQEPSQ